MKIRKYSEIKKKEVHFLHRLIDWLLANNSLFWMPASLWTGYGDRAVSDLSL